MAKKKTPGRSARAAKKKPARKTRKKAASTRTPTSTKKAAAVEADAPNPVAPPWRRVDRLQLAKLLGVHPDTVSDYTRHGMPVVSKGGAGKKSEYDAVECAAWWRSQQGRDSKDAAQTRAYNAQADLNELKLRIQRGELLPRDEVIVAGQNYTKAWTSKIRALPSQMVQAGVIAREQEQRVAALLHSLLQEISRWRTAPKVER